MIDVTVQTLFPTPIELWSDIESTLHYFVVVVNIIVPAARSLQTGKLNKKSERQNLQHVSQFSHCRVLLLIPFIFFLLLPLMCVSFLLLLMLFGLPYTFVGFRTRPWQFNWGSWERQSRGAGRKRHWQLLLLLSKTGLGASHTHTDTHTVVYFIMMDGYDCTQCACVSVCVRVCIQVSVEVSLRCTCSHLAGLGSCRRVGPPSLIVSCTRLSTFACANLSNNICPPSAANYGSQLAAWTLATLHFDPLGDLCSCNRPSWLASASVFAVILRRKSLMKEKKREGERGEEEVQGAQGRGLPHRVCSGFFFVSLLLLLFLCDQRKLIWLVARWLLPVPETLRRRRWQRWRRFISFCWPTFVSCLSLYFFLWMNEKSLLLLLAEVIN